jgi:hypothetical protein
MKSRCQLPTVMTVNGPRSGREPVPGVKKAESTPCGTWWIRSRAIQSDRCLPCSRVITKAASSRGRICAAMRDGSATSKTSGGWWKLAASLPPSRRSNGATAARWWKSSSP